MGEKAIKPEKPGEVGELLAAWLDADAHLKALRDGGRPHWGDEEVHKIQEEKVGIRNRLEELTLEHPEILSHEELMAKLADGVDELFQRKNENND